MKAKNCKACGTDISEWSNTSSLNRFCGYACAASWGAEKQKAKKAKALRDDTKARKEALKTMGDWTKEAQVEFNKYIRMRDFANPCISCGSSPAQKAGGTMDAGHYRSRGSAPHLRFHTLNCFSQCVKCNRNLSGNSVEMRKGMVARLGEQRVLELEHDNLPRRYRVADLKRIKSIFRRRANLYQRLRR